MPLTRAELEAVLAPLVQEIGRLTNEVPDLRAEIAGMREAFGEQARKFDLLRSCFQHVTLSKREAAIYCDCTTRTIDRRVASGKLFAVPGTSRRFTMEELDRALRAGVL